MNKLVFSMVVVCALAAAARGQSPFPPIASGYGANGAFSVTEEKFPSPLYDRENVHVFRPGGAAGKVPVIFFAPGYSNNDPDEYESLIQHIVSRGYAVVFAPFQLLSLSFTPHEKRYDTIFAGFEEAVKRYGGSFDLDRVGYAGHSYGAAAIFSMALRGIEKGWGRQALLLHAMAPWYYFSVSTKQFVNFPPHAKLLMQVFENDGVCDHRMAKEIFERINLPSSEKDFIMLRSEQRLGYKLDAEHGTPSGGTIDALDYYGIYRLFDALADYAFTGNAAGKRVALGNGGPEQRRMGVWPDGQPVREMTAGDCVTITRSSSSFLFPDTGSTPGFATVSSASLKPGPLAPDSLVSAWGTNLSAFPVAAENGPQLTLNGTTVRVKDGVCSEWLSPIFFASPTQVNYLVPSTVAAGSGSISIFNEAGAVSISAAQFGPVSPGLFAANANGQGVAAASVLRVKASGAQVFEKAVEFSVPQNIFISLPIDVAVDGEQVFLMLFGTGLRYRSGLSGVTATVGGLPVEVLYVGSQGAMPGLDQVNLRLPKSLAGRGEMDVILKVDGRTANAVRIKVK
ncbi:MAG: hypothetical protein SF339_07340 [Blastocatellia bacterium]|nr:hypothetical protein [Blastocatellia bacterium]